MKTALTKEELIRLLRVLEKPRPILYNLNQVSYPLKDTDKDKISGIPAWDIEPIMSIKDADRLSPWIERVGYCDRVRHKEIGANDYVFDLALPARHAADLLHVINVRTATPYVPKSDAAVYQINHQLLMKEIALRANISDCEDYPKSVIIPGRLWLLGNVSAEDGYKIPVLFVNRLESVLYKVMSYLKIEQTECLILHNLSSAVDLSLFVKGIEFQSIESVINGNGLKLECSYPPITTTQPMQAVGDLLPPKIVRDDRDGILVGYDPVNRKLSMKGEEDWHVSGEKGASVVEYLVDQAINKRWFIRNAEIMEATQSTIGSSKQISAIFSKNSLWRRYIASPKRGYWGLRSCLDEYAGGVVA